ncbi:hypothetical protein IPA_08100 [Ignicoccus pacificus DSM 13166]|uniref:Radical SAM core domain-containing protein n=1 Tax=Ignicoccus pacificus DSM 13166 TaxID=940294 RepID=A0A977PLX8_9CREN|nr:hypothetical protein IPA_08100 [Ignicoccus pacificus DSM 13166]
MKRDLVRIRLCDKKVVEYNPIMRFLSRRGPSVALVYPAPYSVASQSLGFQLVYALLVSQGIRVERFTSDSCGRSLESGTPLKRFKYVIASLSFELDYAYLAQMLREYGSEGQVVMAGGLAVTANPLPVLDMIDFVILGDAEPTIPKLAEAIHYDCVDCLEEEWLVNEEREGRKAEAELEESPMLAQQFLPISIEPPWGKGFLVEVTRGCPHKCRFCLEGWTSKPFRQRKLDQVKEALDSAGPPFEKIITISLSLSDYKYHKEYLKVLSTHKLQGSIPSIRLEGVDEDLVKAVKRMGQRTLTIAPETTLKEKAEVLGKGFPPEFLKEKLEIIYKYKLKPKMYMMVVPKEKGEMSEREIGNLKEAIKGKVHVSVNPLIPKPWTPLQIAPIPSKDMEKIMIKYKDLGEVDLYPIRWARLQAIIGLSEKPIMRYLDPSLPPEKQMEVLSKVINIKKMENWRPEWEPKWLRYSISNEEEVLRLGRESYEAWRRHFQ